MRIEFTNNTAIWWWSDHVIHLCDGTPVVTADLKRGDRIICHGKMRRVKWVKGDDEFKKTGATWRPTWEFRGGGHPRSGALYVGCASSNEVRS